MCALAPDIRALQAACGVFLDACRCPLCALPWRRASTFPCGHTFCYDCALATLEGPGISQSECPTCKGKYWKRDLRPNPQMITIVEHTQRIVRIAGLQAIINGGRGNNSHGGEAAADCGPYHNSQSESRGAIAGVGAPKRDPHGGNPSSSMHGWPCTVLAAPEIVADEVLREQQHGQKQDGGGLAGRGPGDLTTNLPDELGAASSSQVINDAAAAQWVPNQALTLDAAGLDQSAGLTTGETAGCTAWEQGAPGMQPSKTAAVRLHGHDLPQGQTCRPQMAKGHANPIVPEPIHVREDSGRGNLPLADVGPPMQSVTPNSGTHEAAAARNFPAPVRSPSDLAEADPGPLALPAPVVGEAHGADHVLLTGGNESEEGRWHGDAFENAPNALMPPALEGVSATPSVHGAGLAGDVGWHLQGSVASVAVATPHAELQQQQHLQGGGWATGPSQCGGRPLPGSVVSIRLDIPSVNNAYLDFHALLEQTVSWVARPAAAAQHSAQAIRHGGDEVCGSSDSFEEAAWWFRRLAALPDPMGQEREALEYEAGHVNMLLEELVTMIAELEAGGHCVASAAKVAAQVMDGESADREACVPSVGIFGGLAGEEGVGLRQLGSDATNGTVEARADVSELVQDGLVQGQCAVTVGRIRSTFHCFGADQIAYAVVSQPPPPPPEQLAAGVAGGRDDSEDQRQPSCNGVSGGSCHPVVEVAHEGVVANNSENDNDEEAGRGGHCKRARIEVMSPGLAVPRSLPALMHLSYCRAPGALPTSQVHSFAAGKAASLWRAANTARHDDGGAKAVAHGGADGSGSGDAAAAKASHAMPCTLNDVVSGRRTTGFITGVDNQQAWAATPALAPPPRSPEPCLQREPEQGLNGAAPVVARSGGPEKAAVVLRRRERTLLKRHRSEPHPPPLAPLSQNCLLQLQQQPPSPHPPQQQQQQQPGGGVKNASTTLRQFRRSGVRERASATASIPAPAPFPGAEVAALGPGARRVKALHVLTSGLGPEGRTLVKELTRRVRGVELLTEVQPQLTHLVVNLDPQGRTAMRTIKYLRAVIQGCWVVGLDWVEACLAAGRLVSEGPYEAAGDTVHVGTPAITRLRLEKGGPPLFSGLKFCVTYLKGSFDGGTTKPEVEALLLAGGGTLVRRPTHRATGTASAAPAPVTAAAALFGAAAAADLYDTNTSLCTQQPTSQPEEGERDEGGPRLLSGLPSVFVLVAAHTNVDVCRTMREWGCAPVHVQWVFDCVSWYKLLPTDTFTSAH